MLAPFQTLLLLSAAGSFLLNEAVVEVGTIYVHIRVISGMAKMAVGVFRMSKCKCATGTYATRKNHSIKTKEKKEENIIQYMGMSFVEMDKIIAGTEF